MRYSLLLPLIFLGLAGCVVDRTTPAPTTTTLRDPGTDSHVRVARHNEPCTGRSKSAGKSPATAGLLSVDLARYGRGVALERSSGQPAPGRWPGSLNSRFGEAPRID